MRPSSPRRALLAAAAAALLVAAAALSAPAAAVATAPSYVALGDSFAAGVGSRVYYADGTSCSRSPKSYPALVAGRDALSLTLVACAGAVTADVLHDQVALLRPTTAYVSLTIGGNDLDFADVLSTCALPGWLGHCDRAVDAGLATLDQRLPDRLDQVLAAVRRRSPRADVVVTGYPRLFDDDDCSALTFFSAHERDRLNAATDDLDAVIRARTSAARMRYVDPEPSYRGHAWCDDDAWVNGPSLPTVNSFHPDVRGHAAYADLVQPALVGPDPAVAAGRPAAVLLPASTVRRATGFTPPDPSSAAFSRASRAAGVTAAELRQLRRAVQQGAPAATLDHLDATISRRVEQRRLSRAGAAPPRSHPGR